MTSSTQNYIQTMREAEDSMMEDSLDRLGTMLDLFEHVCRTGYLVLECFGAANKTALDDRTKILVQMYIACRYHLLTAAMNLFKGHSVDAKSSLRKSIEFALFATSLFENEKAAAAWMNMADDYDGYRAEFKIMKLLDKKRHENLESFERRFLNSLIDMYETCSNSVHATVMAAAPVVYSNQVGDDLHVAMSLVDSDETRKEGFLLTYFWIVDIGLYCLGLFASLFWRTNRQFELRRVLDSIEVVMSDPRFVAAHNK